MIPEVQMLRVWRGGPYNAKLPRSSEGRRMSGYGRGPARCRRAGKRPRIIVGAANDPRISADLIVRKVTVNGVEARGLVDSGSTRTIVGPNLAIKKQLYSSRLPGFIVGFDGSRVQTAGESIARVEMEGKAVQVSVVHSRSMLGGGRPDYRPRRSAPLPGRDG